MVLCWLQEDAEMEVVALSILSAEAKEKPEELVLEECELECECLGIHNGAGGARNGDSRTIQPCG